MMITKKLYLKKSFIFIIESDFKTIKSNNKSKINAINLNYI